jgi:AcrR family transcriptional regulator
MKDSKDNDKMTEKQKRIMNAAIEVFSEKGYAGSTTSEIARRAGVAEGTIFCHYKTKKDLLISIVSPLMINIMAPLLMKQFVKVINTPYESFDDFLRAIYTDRIKFVRANLPLIKILIQEIPFHEDLRNTFKDVIGKHVINHFIKAIEHYQEQGLIRDDPPETIVRFMMSSGIGLVVSMMLVVPEMNWDEDIEIERTIKTMMHGLAPVS